MKLTTSYTKKVPGEEDYSSEGFGATIEVEVPDEQSQDAAVVQGWIRELFDQAMASVEEQIKALRGRNGNGATSQASSLFGRGNGKQPEHRSQGGSGQGVATPKQVLN